MKSTLLCVTSLFLSLTFSAGCSTADLGKARETSKFGNVVNQSHLLFVAKLCTIVDAVQAERKGGCLRSYNGIMQSKFEVNAREPGLADLTSIVCDQIPENSKPTSYHFVRYYCLRNAYSFAVPKEQTGDMARCGNVTSQEDPTARSRGDCFENAFQKLVAHNRPQDEFRTK